MTITFNNPFYIRQVSDDHFILCIKESHYCMTAGTLSKCLEMVTTFVKRYKKVGKLYQALRNFDDHGQVGKVCFEEREQWYQTGEWKMFDKDVKVAVREGLEYLEEHTSTKKIKKVLKSSPLKKITTVETKKSTPALTNPKTRVGLKKVCNKPKIVKLQ